METRELSKRVIAVLFILFISVGFIKGNPICELEAISNYLCQDSNAEDSITIDLIEREFTDSLWNKEELINLNGLAAKVLSIHGYYSDKGIYITKNDKIVSPSKKTSTDYEVNEVLSFVDFLDANNVNFIYVNEPTKYLDDTLFEEEFGVETYCNRNADLLLNRLKDKGINVIDLRENILSSGISIENMFYRTDHHWTTRTGLWATQVISEGLNEYCRYNIDLSIFNIEKYDVKKWNECWLGEQGRKVAKSYVGLDDYESIKPLFETSYTFTFNDEQYEGTFDDFINDKVYDTNNDVYDNPSWHYSYNRIDCINDNVNSGKILLICDSYGYVVQPFLSLGVYKADSIILRDMPNEFDIRQYILDGEYDTVILAYAEFMIGAHDDINSANYRMFMLE